MKSEYHRLLLIFVDGLGLAAASEDNPLAGRFAEVTSILDMTPQILECLGAASTRR